MITKKITTKIREKIDYAYNLSRDFAIDNGLIANHDNYQKFIILSSGRSGSNFLVSLLQSHTKIRVYNEVFHFHNPVWGYSGMDYKNSAERLAVRNKNLTQYVEQELYGQYPKNIEAVGFKLLYLHMEKNKEVEQWRQEILKSIHNFDNIKIIHLQRNNLLKACLSSAIAIRDNRWIVNNKNNLKDIEPIELSSEQCLRYFEEVQSHKNKYTNLLNGYPMIDIYYEDLSINSNDVTKQIQNFLGIEVQELKTATKKIIQSPLSSQINNYYELKEKFINTPYEEYFTE